MSSAVLNVPVTCSVCCDPFTKQLRKPIVCPVSTCGYSACHNCYKTFLTTDGITSSKCMQCNTEFTVAFLKQHFAESFIKKELRQKFTDVLVQRQVAQLPMSQPNAERELMAREKSKEIAQIDELVKSLTIQKRILQDDVRFLRNTRNHTRDGEEVATFQHKCCDSNCPGFVSASWKCGICNKFSCTHCHEVKGTTREEVEAHACNPETVESIKFLKTDTKPCPSCGIYIHKTEGCDQMFCTSCKQLWSWNTGRIEKRGHNPHYLEWMRSRNGGDLVRDPADVQCGREIDWRFNGSIHASLRSLNQRCGKNANIEIERHRGIISKWCESIIHVRHHDVPLFRSEAETDRTLEQLRISYMLKRTSEPHFRLRVFQVHRNAEVSRQILELMIAMQNAATDILYRIHDTVTDASTSDVTIILTQIETQLLEMTELRKYAIRCLTDIYQTSSKTAKYAFTRDFSFALSN